MKNFSSKEIRFSGDSIKSCIVFIDLVDSTKNTHYNGQFRTY